MKRIIELSENDYKELKEDGVQNHLALADTIIANSIPYEEKPQVTVFAENASKEEIEDFKGELERVLERPQGEWIDHSEDYGYVECPVCEHLTSCEGNKDELHYCWNCGSKMGKGSAE